MKQHSESNRLRGALDRSEDFSDVWKGTVYRSVSVRYANSSDLLSGIGAKIAGARWNPPNSIALVYASLDVETSVAEALAHHRYYGIPVELALPRVLVSIQVQLGCILDLSNAKIRRRLGLTQTQLVSEDWRRLNARKHEALTQAIGRLSAQISWGCEGLLVPSACRHRGVNLLVFPDNLRAPQSTLEIINCDQLPPGS